MVNLIIFILICIFSGFIFMVLFSLVALRSEKANYIEAFKQLIVDSKGLTWEDLRYLFTVVLFIAAAQAIIIILTDIIL